MGEYCSKYRRNRGNKANHWTLNNKYEKTVVVEGNRLAKTTELRMARFNDRLVGNLHCQSTHHKQHISGRGRSQGSCSRGGEET